MTRCVALAAFAIVAAGCTAAPSGATGEASTSTGAVPPVTTMTTTPPTTAIADPGPPPEPLPGEDGADYLVRCAAHFGMVAYNAARIPEAIVSGGVTIIHASKKTPAQREQMELCTRVGQEAGILYDENDPEQVRERYGHLLELLDCLAQNGWPVPDPPSEEVFVETKGDFDPYSEMGFGSIRDSVGVCVTEFPGVSDLSRVDFSKLGQGD